MKDHIVCPVCGDEIERLFYDEIWGTPCEEHIYCEKCGYRYEMSYSKPIDGFCDGNIKEWIRHTFVRLKHINKRSVRKMLFDYKTRKMFRHI